MIQGLLKTNLTSIANAFVWIKKVVEEQLVHEFLNDAVMEDRTRIEVGKLGFCEKHFDMLLSRPNKLSVALQLETRVKVLQK